MRSDNPLVSIIIPVYNGANYLREAIDSALAQTYPNVEIIVVNDGSDDDGKTDVIARSYGIKIRYYAKENGGVSSALNFGFNQMHGDYFSWLSHDDVFTPVKTSTQIGIAKTLDRLTVLYSDFDVVDEKSAFLHRHRIFSSTTEDILYGLLTRSAVNGCTTLIPKRCFEKVGLFDESLRTTQDFDMWLRLAKQYDFIHIPEALIKSRYHKEQGTFTIAGHREAENQFYMSALTALPKDYLEKKLSKEGSLFFLKIGFHLRRRGFSSAADFSKQLSNKYKSYNLIWYFPKIIMWRVCDLLLRLFFRFKSVRKFIKQINRVVRLVD